jgi:pyruvate/2-oxoglutarate dehydrogenase complex dihydrolipoamide acyltransferase (E2) component
MARRAGSSETTGGVEMQRRSHDVEPLPAGRREVLDLLQFARRVPVVHGLLEVDVSLALRSLEQRAEAVTFTTFVVACVGRAVAEHPDINVRRAGRRLVRFHDVDVVVTAEHHADDVSVPVPNIVRGADRRSVDELAAEMRQARLRAAGRGGSERRRTVLERVPSPVRRLGLRAATNRPAVAARLGPAIGVSSLGMFGSGIAWGVPVSPLTLMVTVGSIGQRPTVSDGARREADTLALTLSFDHTVVDGAPAARFATTLRAMLEEATVLE